MTWVGRWAAWGLGLGVLFLTWLGAAMVIGSDLIVPGPVQVFRAMVGLGSKPEFWIAIAATSRRVLEGFLLALGLSLVLGLSAGLSRFFEDFLRPGITFMQAVPVLSVILILLIWFGSNAVPRITAILLTLPVMTEAVIAGVRGVDQRLLEMARAYRVPLGRQVSGIIVPSILPGLFAGASASLGLTWKVAVAAEVLAQPNPGLGTAMQRAKAILDTGEVFAWTLAAVALSGLTQGIFSLAARRWRTHGRG
ncbi:MAG: ABC transporter permease subunit [Spirochaetales bacterium]|nr:ABC transporter permease subunit [Spirochaetales bacterium]